MTKVLGMGNALIDILAVIEDDKILELLDLPKGSMQLIDDAKLEIINKERENIHQTIVAGGSASNTITGLVRLGVDTGFVGCIGKDYYGNYYKEDLHTNKVKSHLTEIDQASGVSCVFISKDGERTFGTYLGAAALLNASELKPEDFRGYEYFYIEGYLVQSHELIKRAIVLAKEAGSKIILDMASYNVVEANKEFLLDIIPQYVDIVFANEEEAKALFGVEPEKAVSLLAELVDIAIVKTGKTGSWIQRGKEKVFVPALTVNCVDTTGAGDVYAAGFLYGLINNYSLSVSGQIGTLLAGNVIQYLGAKIKEDNWKNLYEEINHLSIIHEKESSI